MIDYNILSDMKKKKGVTWGYLESVINAYRGKFVDYKKGKTTFTQEEEIKLSEALDTTVAFLCGATDKSEQKNKPADDSKLKEDEKLLLDYFRQLTPQEKKVFEVQIRAIVESKD